MSQIDSDRKLVEEEYLRMGFDVDSKWRISDRNKDFELCNTYPRYLIVPSAFKDEDLESVAKFRYFRRIPTAVWRHTKNGCFIVRSSQPTVGWFGWFRSELDENLVQSYVNNSIESDEEGNSTRKKDDDGPSVPQNPPKTANQNQSNLTESTTTETERQVDGDTIDNDENDTRILIIDARSYTAAMANRAKGGGCECSEYYRRCEVHFMSLANIHSIRKSYHAIRNVCEAYSEQSNK